MKTGIPQIIVIVLFIIELAFRFINHRRKVEYKINFWADLIYILIYVNLLKSGGFF